MNFLSRKSTICTTFTCTQNHFSCTHIHTYMCTCIHTCQVYITHHSTTYSTFTLTFAYFLHIKHAFTHTKIYTPVCKVTLSYHINKYKYLHETINFGTVNIYNYHNTVCQMHAMHKCI